MGFFWVAIILLGGIVLFFLLLGGLTSGTGADLLDWDPIGHSERKAASEAADFEELMELNNKFRRERGARPLSEYEVRSGRLREPPGGSGAPAEPGEGR